MAGIFTLLLISYILTVGLRDFGTAVAGIFTLLLISYILTVGLRDCGGRHFHSFTNITYIDYGTAGLRWQAFSLSHSYTDCGTARLRWQACVGTKAILIFHSHIYIMTTGPRTAVFVPNAFRVARNCKVAP